MKVGLVIRSCALSRRQTEGQTLVRSALMSLMLLAVMGLVIDAGIGSANRRIMQNAADIAGECDRAGHDFWLTRNGHGAGFWDGDWPDDAGGRLTEASKKYGEFNLYVGDDGLIHGY